jgi:hypothetical protein
MVGFEMGSIPDEVMWKDVMWTTKPVDLKRTMDIWTAARSLQSIRVQSPFQMARGGEPPSESDKGVRCSG